MSYERRPIPPNPPRWQPNSDPSSIHVPGLDTSASVTDQIEQMEQLITIKLQNIDENFSKIHHILANKLLPAVKRYAVGTEPVREAAKFWTSFYEQAAQIHIPTYDDYSTVNEMPSESEQVEAETGNDSRLKTTPFELQHHDHSIVSTESSFMPGQAAFSSTPATARVTQTFDSFTSQTPDKSWSVSLESPLVRLDRELQKFSKEDEDVQGSSTSSSLRFDEPTPNLKRQESVVKGHSGKGKTKEGTQPLLHDVLRHNLHSMSDISSGTILTNISPMKSRGKLKTPIPKEYNPYLSPKTNPRDWNGVVDLRDPSIMTTPRFSRTKPSSRQDLSTPAKQFDDDESFDGLPPGMSPPVLMSPARPPRSSAELGLLKLGQTPTKEATARITQDLLRDIQHKSGRQTRSIYEDRTDSSMSTMPTPPSLSKYHNQDITDSIAMDSSFDSIMRRVGLDVPPSIRTASTPGLRLRPKAAATGASKPHQPSNLQSGPITNVSSEPLTPVHPHDQGDIDSDSDSFDEVNNTAHPSAAFMMASQGHRDSDDSFGSSNHSSDSLTEEDVNLGLVPVHPFAIGVEDNGFDDSFDDDMYDQNVAGETEEETVFGVPPAQRIHGQGRPGVGRGMPSGGLHMLGEDLLQETMGIGQQIAMSGRVEVSPTPASWLGGRGQGS